jgi:hypothetical protein
LSEPPFIPRSILLVRFASGTHQLFGGLPHSANMQAIAVSSGSPMTEQTEIRLYGKDCNVPSIRIRDRNVVAVGKWLKIACVHDEFFVEGEIVPKPQEFISEVQRWHVKPDLFTFAQKVNDLTPRFPFYFEWEDLAVIPITTYDHWVKKQIRKGTRVNLHRATREGVFVRSVAFTNEFVKGIKELYDETPVRQGKPFWHYGKSLEDIKKVHSTYSERAEYIGAYFEGELIGFLKMVYVDDVAKTMNVIGKEKYFHKRITNALIAKAVEVCAEKRVRYFNYGQYSFPGKQESSLTDFKRRNGFEAFRVPRYYVPLTSKGKLALKVGLHRETNTLVPWPVMKALLKVRSLYYLGKRRASAPLDSE